MPIITDQKIIKRWTSFYGKSTVNEFQYLNKSGISNFIRINYLKTTDNELIPTLEKKGYILEQMPLTGAYKIIKQRISLGATHEFLLGHYSIQGLASQLVSHIVLPNHSDTVLDMSAAPGGKTAHMATLMDNNGLIVAIDNSKHRMTALRSNLARQGVSNVLAFLGDSSEITTNFDSFDKILLDAPCSGSGSICKRPDKRWEKDVSDIERLAVKQTNLLETALKYLKIGGELTFSTCSIEPEEGEQQIVSLLEKYSEKIKVIDLQKQSNLFSQEELRYDYSNNSFYTNNKNKWLRITPKNDYEGFFICKVKKTKELNN